VAEQPYLAAVRESYDTVAADYVKLVKIPEAMDPLGRAMLNAFTDLVQGADRGPVADRGCGPGRVTAYLAAHGLSVSGVDLSPKMIELARQAHPGIRFTVGSMTALDLGDATLGGILAWYSTYHTPAEYLPVVYAEFQRTLAPGGLLLLGSYVGDDAHLRPSQAYGGHTVTYESFLLPLDRITELLGQAGLVVIARLLQEPDEATIGRSWSVVAPVRRQRPRSRTGMVA